MELVLYQPEIPPNTGNIARLCAATNTPLHLIEPLGFSLDDRYLKRAGLDYWPAVDLHVWPDWDSFTESWTGSRLIFTSARQGRPLHRFSFQPGDGHRSFLIEEIEDDPFPCLVHQQRFLFYPTNVEKSIKCC